MKRWIQEAKSSFAACPNFGSLKNQLCHLGPVQLGAFTWNFLCESAWSGYFWVKYLSGPPAGKTTSCNLTCETNCIDSQFDIASSKVEFLMIFSSNFASNNPKKNCDKQPLHNLWDMRKRFNLLGRKLASFARLLTSSSSGLALFGPHGEGCKFTPVLSQLRLATGDEN